MNYTTFKNEVNTSNLSSDAVMVIDTLIDSGMKFFNDESVEEIVGKDKATFVIKYLKSIKAVEFMKSYGFYMVKVIK